jgi:hypothetical protein
MVVSTYLLTFNRDSLCRNEIKHGKKAIDAKYMEKVGINLANVRRRRHNGRFRDNLAFDKISIIIHSCITEKLAASGRPDSVPVMNLKTKLN